MQEMETQGKRFGVEENPLREVGNTVDYSFPVERKEFLFVTSPFGMRQDPADGKERMHTGIDIRCDGDTVLATEKDGTGCGAAPPDRTAPGAAPGRPHRAAGIHHPRHRRSPQPHFVGRPAALQRRGFGSNGI